MNDHSQIISGVNEKIGDRMVSIYPPLSSGPSRVPLENTPIWDALMGIKNGIYKEVVQKVRKAEGKVKKRKAKMELPSLMPTGVFENGLKDMVPDPFSGLLQVDIDDVPDVQEVKSQLMSDPHIYSCFVSPSGRGVKGLIRVPQDSDPLMAKQAVVRHLSAVHGLEIDEGPCGINYRMYVSYDPELYINKDCRELPLEFCEEKDQRDLVVGGSKESFREYNLFPLDEIKCALGAIPDRPDYDLWIRLANAVRDAAGTENAVELLKAWSPEERPGEYGFKICELPLVKASCLFEEAYRNGWSPEVYYENSSNRYWLMDADSKFRTYTQSHLTDQLKRYGLDGEQAASVARSARFRFSLDCVLNVAGMPKGLNEMNGKKLLVPRGPNLIEPHQGEWETIKAIFVGMLGETQYEYFIWWLALSLQSLYGGNWQPAQVLALVGPTASAKSLTQSILTLLFGGTEARVMQAVSGSTPFNGDWAEAAHLVIEDEFSDNNKSTRDRIKERVKEIAVNRRHRIHPKGKDAIDVTPFWRLTISCNPVPESLAVMPHLDESSMNKISILGTKRFEMPMPAATAKEKEKLWSAVRREAPALIHDLLSWGNPPAHLRDEENRFDLAAYHDEGVKRMIEDMSQEFELLNLIIDGMRKGHFDVEDEFDGGHSETNLKIEVTAAEVHEVLRYRGLPSWMNTRQIGKMLSYLTKIRPEYVTTIKSSRSNGNRYQIVGNGGEIIW
ncbi:BT4734/BF3469 family protein [Ruficoccus sp. ZRK36]|uniref:BT4734/BF3469 family protein n=1 Tax=Ruficoccus sp. ZRK36 TaxID=2866311 RepID=UPI001C732D38|nr:BT4734/BF3469 family protein [Ruficoccus sp. ZRK36]QYY36865.1 hypothetical protein K0V07_05155 [Ruficoccus sp. ZRK36]